MGEAGDEGGYGFDLFLRGVAVAFVGDFEEVEAAAIEITGAGEDLVLGAWLGGEEAFVEEVGGEGGDAWRETPGDGEEDAAVFGDGEGGGGVAGARPGGRRGWRRGFVSSAPSFRARSLFV